MILKSVIRLIVIPKGIDGYLREKVDSQIDLNLIFLAGKLNDGVICHEF
jgi:hypothetical protein